MTSLPPHNSPSVTLPYTISTTIATLPPQASSQSNNNGNGTTASPSGTSQQHHKSQMQSQSQQQQQQHHISNTTTAPICHHITIPANTLPEDIWYPDIMPPSWRYDVSRQLKQRINEERHRKLRALVKEALVIGEVSGSQKEAEADNGVNNLKQQQRPRQQQQESHQEESASDDEHDSVTTTVPSIASTNNNKQQRSYSLTSATAENTRNHLISHAHLSRLTNYHKMASWRKFQHHFDSVFFRSELRQRHLVKIEQQMALVYKDSLNESKREIDAMRKRHAEEMTRICLAEETGMESADQMLSFTSWSSKQDADSRRHSGDSSKSGGRSSSNHHNASSSTTEYNPSGNTLDVSKIVTEHMSQITQLEKKWHIALQDLKVQQIQQYRKFVKDVYQQVVDTEIPDADGHCFSTQQLNLNKGNFRRRIWSHSTGPDAAASEPDNWSANTQASSSSGDSPSSGEYPQRIVNHYVNSLSSYLKKQQTLNTPTNNGSGAPSRSRSVSQTASSTNSGAKSSSTSSAPSTPITVPRCISRQKHQWFSISIDSVLYDKSEDGSSILSGNTKEQLHAPDALINLFVVLNSDFADTLSLYSAKDELEQRTRNLGNLYKNRLNAFIVDCCYNDKDKKCIWHSTQFRKMQYHATQSQAPDLHFEDMSRQLQEIHRNMHPVQAGDFFVTKHSNLAWIHLMMHLVTLHETNLESEEYYNNLMTGLENLFEDCYHLGVHNIFLSLPLTNVPPNPFVEVDSSGDDEEARDLNASTTSVVTATEEVLVQLKDVLTCYQKRVAQHLRQRERTSVPNRLKNFIVYLNPSVCSSRKELIHQVSQLVEDVFGKRNVMEKGFSS